MEHQVKRYIGPQKGTKGWPCDKERRRGERESKDTGGKGERVKKRGQGIHL
jgi:hypothetical protein